MADREDPRQQDRTKTPPQGSPQDAVPPPQEEEVIVEEGNPDLTENDPLSGMEEPYGSQVLRMWYEAFILQMQEVDSVLQPLDNPKVIKLAMTIQQSIDKMIQAIQALHAGEYESRGLPPLSEPMQEEEEVVMEDSEPEDIDDMRPTPDEAVEGMQSMGLRGKSLSYSKKGLLDHLIKNMDVGWIDQKAVKQKVGMRQLLSILGNLQRELGISEGAAKRQQQEFTQKYRSKNPKISEGEDLRDEDITDQHKEAFLKLIGAKDPEGKPQSLQQYRERASRYAADEARIKNERNEDIGKNKVAEAEKASRQIRLPEDQREVHARRVASGQIPYRMASEKETAKIEKPRGSTERGGVAISSLPPKMQESIAQSQASGTMPKGDRYGARIAQRNEQAKADYQDSQMRQVHQQHDASHAKSYSMKCMCKEQPCTCSGKNLKESGNKYPQAGDWMKQQAGSILEACGFLDKISTEDEDGGFNWGEKSRQEAYHLSKVLDDIVPDAEFKDRKRVKSMGEGSYDSAMGTVGGDSTTNLGSEDPDGGMGDGMKFLIPVKKFLQVISGEKAFGYQHQEAARACKFLLTKALNNVGIKATQRGEYGQIITREEAQARQQAAKARRQQQMEELRNRDDRYDIKEDPPWHDPAAERDMDAYASEVLGASPVDAQTADQAHRYLASVAGRGESMYGPGEVDEIMSGMNPDIDMGDPAWRTTFEGLQEGEEVPVYEEYPGRPGQAYLESRDNFQLAEDAPAPQEQGTDYSGMSDDVLNTLRQINDEESGDTPAPSRKEPLHFDEAEQIERERKMGDRVLSSGKGRVGNRVDRMIESRGKIPAGGNSHRR